MNNLDRTDVTFQEGTVRFLNSEPKKLLIGGSWIDASSGETFETINPANGKLLGRIALAGEDDVNRAVEAARAAFDGGPWRQMSGEDRASLLFALADLIDANADELAELETLDNGKPIRVSRRGDLPYVSLHFRYYAGWAGKLEGSTLPVSMPDQFVYTLREPVGVVGLIIPWNFPLLMCAWKLAPALACGNTTLLKPAEETPLTALRLGELIQEAGFPEGVVNILTGPGEPTGAAIAAHPGVDKIAFTGSTDVGRKILMASAGSNLKKVSLELGGKSPNVIFADADLSRTIKGATWAAFSTAGQECVAGSRLFVERPVYDQVLEGIAGQAASIRVGDGFTPKIHLGPVITENQMGRVLGFLERGRDDGAEVVAGGTRLGGDLADGYFISPAVFSFEDDSIEIAREEIFGPVVGVTPFDDWDEVVMRANASRYGLAAGIWTENLGKAHRFARALKAGTVWVNGYGYFDPAAPFGGVKESGFGREMGKEALDLYTQVKTVWINTA
ncbi:MAG TPA: aldehyde dehydrogenase family protein [Anaerolineales bacterium]|nr:aldehyde dehydrogenase family protein [Anaerolineales bacterium]